MISWIKKSVKVIKMSGQRGNVVPDRPPVIFAGHNTYLMSVTKVCREAEQFVDVALRCDDGKLLAHKLVLASASKFLHQLLLDHSSVEDEPPVILIPDVSTSSLAKILDFIYTASSPIS